MSAWYLDKEKICPSGFITLDGQSFGWAHVLLCVNYSLFFPQLQTVCGEKECGCLSPPMWSAPGAPTQDFRPFEKHAVFLKEKWQRHFLQIHLEFTETRFLEERNRLFFLNTSGKNMLYRWRKIGSPKNQNKFCSCPSLMCQDSPDLAHLDSGVTLSDSLFIRSRPRLVSGSHSPSHQLGEETHSRKTQARYKWKQMCFW